MPTPYEPAATAARPGAPSAPGVPGGYATPDVGAPGMPYAVPPLRPPLVRARGRGWTPGVSAAVARHLGVSVRGVRWAFVLLTLVGGAGIAAYVFLWVLTPEGDVDAEPGAAPEGDRKSVV